MQLLQLTMCTFPKPNTAALKIFSEKEPNFIKESVFIGDSDRTDGAFLKGLEFLLSMSFQTGCELNNNTGKKMKLLDCTLRDGGYYNNWDLSIVGRGLSQCNGRGKS